MKAAAIPTSSPNDGFPRWLLGALPAAGLFLLAGRFDWAGLPAASRFAYVLSAYAFLVLFFAAQHLAAF